MVYHHYTFLSSTWVLTAQIRALLTKTAYKTHWVKSDKHRNMKSELSKKGCYLIDVKRYTYITKLFFDPEFDTNCNSGDHPGRSEYWYVLKNISCII